MGYVHSREGILAAALEVVTEVGLSGLTYRLVAQRLKIADRTIVYYFPTKNVLLRELLEVITERLREVLGRAIGEGPLTTDEVQARMWSALAVTDVDPVFRVYLETVGLSAARRSPYEEIGAAVYHEWVRWLEQRIAETPTRRRAAAVAALAQVDGLLMVRHLVSPELAEEAARLLGMNWAARA